MGEFLELLACYWQSYCSYLQMKMAYPGLSRVGPVWTLSLLGVAWQRKTPSFVKKVVLEEHLQVEMWWELVH